MKLVSEPKWVSAIIRPMAAVTPTKPSDRKLGLKELLDWMVADGLVEAAAASSPGDADPTSPG
jgi:hypothetical protein